MTSSDIQSTDLLLKAVDRLYGEVLDDADWTKGLHALQETLNCRCMCVAIHDEETQHNAQHTFIASVPDDEQQHPPCTIDAATKLQSVTDNSSTTIEASEFSEMQRQHWNCTPDSCNACLVAPLIVGDGSKAVAVAHWIPPERADLDENRRLLQGILPHLARVLLLEHRQAEQRSQDASSAFLMEGIPQAVVLVDGKSLVLRMNSRARQVIAAADGLTLVDRELRAERVGRAGPLSKRIQAVIDSNHPRVVCRTAIPRPSGAVDYTLMVEPLLKPGQMPERDKGAALVIISDAASTEPLPWRALMDMFDLTRSEARVAVLLAAGKSLKEIAAELKIAYRTASLHLEHAMRKTGTHRQSELLRLLLLSPAILTQGPKNLDD